MAKFPLMRPYTVFPVVERTPPSDFPVLSQRRPYPFRSLGTMRVNGKMSIKVSGNKILKQIVFSFYVQCACVFSMSGLVNKLIFPVFWDT